MSQKKLPTSKISRVGLLLVLLFGVTMIGATGTAAAVDENITVDKHPSSNYLGEWRVDNATIHINGSNPTDDSWDVQSNSLTLSPEIYETNGNITIQIYRSQLDAGPNTVDIFKNGSVVSTKTLHKYRQIGLKPLPAGYNLDKQVEIRNSTDFPSKYIDRTRKPTIQVRNYYVGNDTTKSIDKSNIEFLANGKSLNLTQSTPTTVERVYPEDEINDTITTKFYYNGVYITSQTLFRRSLENEQIQANGSKLYNNSEHKLNLTIDYSEISRKNYGLEYQGYDPYKHTREDYEGDTLITDGLQEASLLTNISYDSNSVYHINPLNESEVGNINNDSLVYENVTITSPSKRYGDRVDGLYVASPNSNQTWFVPDYVERIELGDYEIYLSDDYEGSFSDDDDPVIGGGGGGSGFLTPILILVGILVVVVSLNE